MNPKLDPILDQIRGGWRFRWHAFGVAATIALVGWLLIFTLPDRYEAESKVLVNTRTALQPALQGLVVAPDVSGELDYVRQALLSDPQLGQFVNQAGLLPAGLTPKRRQMLLYQISKRVDISIDQSQSLSDSGQGGSATYGIRYQDVNRLRALALVKLLTSSLVDETLGGSQQGSLRAQAFLKSQIAAYEQRLQDAENRLAAFKSQHFGLLASQQGGYFQQLGHETQAIEDIKTKLLVAQSRHRELTQELHGNAAISSTDATPVIGPNGQLVGGDTMSQIQAAEARLNQLLLKYTGKYPDVIATREQLAQLKQRRAQEIKALQQGDASVAASSGASSNPIYQGIVLALNKTDVEVADLQTELGDHQQKARELKKLLDSTPQLEAQYAQLSRDYDINKTQYAALLASYDKARLGQQAGNAGAVRFELVEPPMVSYTPVSPRRGSLLGMVLLAALGAGGGLAYWLNQHQPVVASASGLRQLAGIPVSIVGPAFPTRSARSFRGDVARFALACGCLLAVFVLAVVLSYMGVRLGGLAGGPPANAV
ncbi:MAG TPA: XrtA system polysaccharide chain length determinant [Steroidobacteraceae bacterium]|jgi:polysaccharide chain length determinant protein (PEP-CTERM system associated)|nr:XrtA system polysaccharide chain length determinant [Steroidobacteraceae bacterium]